MPKLVCPHSGIFAVIKKQSSSEVEDVEVVDLTGEEDGESVDYEDEDESIDHDLVESQNVQIAMAKAHSGRVKALAKMYDKFAEVGSLSLLKLRKQFNF